MNKTGMHELRKDPLLGRWVAVLHESRSPSDYGPFPEGKDTIDSCLLCRGRETETPAEIMIVPEDGNIEKSPDWSVRVIPHFDPVFEVHGDLGRRGEGLYDKMNGIGTNEIIIESPDHSVKPEDRGPGHMLKVLKTYRDRMIENEKDPRYRYTLIFRNSGRDSGAVFSHPVSHLVSTPIIPKRIKEELDGAKQYYSYKERCVFCDIIREEMRVGKRIIIESEHHVAFCPYASKFPFECWILPKVHNCAYQDIGISEMEDLSSVLCTVLKKVQTVFKNPPWNYFLHSAPNRIPRKNYWHTLGEDYHWHFEVIPRLLTISGFEWGSGFYVLPTSPENAASILKEV